MSVTRKWTKEEDLIVTQNQHLPTQEIVSKLKGRSYNAVTCRKQKLGVTRKRVIDQHTIHRLLEESHEAYYWMGFLLADGTFVSKKSYIGLQLSDTDKNHIVKYAKFISRKATICVRSEKGKISRYVSCSVADQKVFDRLVTKFCIKDRKTYNPPDFLPEDDLFFLSFLIGFIDADGSIHNNTTNKSRIQIEIHRNWKGWLSLVKYRIEQICNCKIANIKTRQRDTTNYAAISFSHTMSVYLKSHIVKHNLPALERKWDKVNVNLLTQKQKRQRDVSLVKDMLLRGLSSSKIVNHFSHSSKVRVYSLIKEATG